MRNTIGFRVKWSRRVQSPGEWSSVPRLACVLFAIGSLALIGCGEDDPDPKGAGGSGGTIGQGGSGGTETGDGGTDGSGGFGGIGAGGEGGETGAEVKSVSVNPTSHNLVPFATVRFDAQAFDDAGDVVMGRSIAWTSSFPEIASIDGEGLATAHKPGEVLVTATIDGVSGTATLVVGERIPETVEIRSDWTELAVGNTAAVEVRVIDTMGEEIEDPVVAFSSSDSNVATVDPDTGEVRGRGPGAARIEVVAGTVSTGVDIDVFFRFGDFTAGYHQSCALTLSGEAWCWGSNEDGFLGDGSTVDAATPVRVATDVEFMQIKGTEGQVCGLAKDREVWCWGLNTLGSTFGPNHTELESSNVPVAVGVQSYGFESLSFGNGFVCGLDGTGTAYCWGRNTTFHELGNGDPNPTATPTKVAAPEGGSELRFRMLRTGERHSCGITLDGDLYCWGHNHRGEAGIGSTDEFASIPTAIMPGTRFKAMEFGVQHGCAITEADATYCWGANRDGAIGLGTIGGEIRSPTEITATPATFTSFGMGWSYTIGIDTTGQLWSWGTNEEWVLGRDTGEALASGTPTQVDTALRFTKVDGNADHACGLATDGILYCWGANGEDRLGTGTADERSMVPTPVVGQ